MVTGWYGVDGAWEYYSTSGAQARSWVQVGSSWYYLDPETGIMRTGWQKVGDSLVLPGCLGGHGDWLGESGWVRGTTWTPMVRC